VRYSVQDFGLQNWSDLADYSTDPPTPLDPAGWPAAGTGSPMKRITLRVSSDNRFLAGRREFVVTTLKIRDPGP
jgi:hypothetical protein